MTINELTFVPRGIYAESLKTVIPAFTPRQSVFFMPMAWTRAENNQYQPKLCIAAFSESTPLSFLVALLKKAIQMTTLSDTYDAYVKLRQILKDHNNDDSPFNSDTDKAMCAVCEATNSLETAIAYFPLEEKSDRKIKLTILKKTITEIAEDNNGKIDLDQLTPRAREQLAITLQLIKEQKQ